MLDAVEDLGAQIGELLGAPGGTDLAVERQVVPHERDLSHVGVHPADREFVERQLAVCVRLVLRHQSGRGLVVVDLPDSVRYAIESIDEADDLVLIVERQRNAELEPDGHRLVERVVAAVVVAKRLLTDGAVVVGRTAGADDPHVVPPLRVPHDAEALREGLLAGDAARLDLAVEPFERVVRAAAHEGLDPVRALRRFDEVRELVLLRARLVRLDARV